MWLRSLTASHSAIRFEQNIAAVLFGQKRTFASHFRYRFLQKMPNNKCFLMVLVAASSTGNVGTVTADEDHPPLVEPSGSLTLADAASLALGLSPHLEPFSLEVNVQEAAAIQAAAYKNPELSLVVENAYGEGPYHSRDLVEETLSIGQTIELGKKRPKRKEIASRDIEMANQAYQVQRMEVLSAVAKAFLDTLHAQEQLAFAEESLLMQQEIAEAQAVRLRAGKLSESEVEIGRTALALAKVDAETMRSAWRQTKQALSSQWGNPHPVFQQASGTLAAGTELPDEESLRQGLKNHPALHLVSQLIERQSTLVEYAEANRIPDLTAEVGVRRFRESGDHAMVFQMSIPLPLFNRNRGNIRQAQAELRKARAEQVSAQAHLESLFADRYEKLSAAHREIQAIEETVLPSAELSFRYANESYQLGKFSYFELKAAQATLIESRKKLLDAELRFHKAKVDLEILAGRPL